MRKLWRSIEVPEVLFPVVSISIPKIVYIQFYLLNFNEFRFKNKFKRQACTHMQIRYAMDSLLAEVSHEEAK